MIGIGQIGQSRFQNVGKYIQFYFNIYILNFLSKEYLVKDKNQNIIKGYSYYPFKEGDNYY